MGDALDIGPLWPGGPDAFVRPSPCQGCRHAQPDPAHREHYALCGWRPTEPAAMWWDVDAVGFRACLLWENVCQTPKPCPVREDADG